MRILIISFFVVTENLFVFAQTAPLTLPEAIDLALKNNTSIRKEYNNMMSYKAYEEAALFGLGPSINASGNLGRRSGNSFNQQEGKVINGAIDFLSGSINANVVLFGGFKNQNTLKSARQQLAGQEQLVKFTRQEVISQVAQAYLQTILNQELLKIALENLTLQQTGLLQIKNEVELGSKASVEEYNQVALVKNAELEAFRAEVNLRNAKTSLALAMQSDPSIDYQLVAPQLNNIVQDDFSLEELYITAESQRGDLQASMLMENSQKFDMAITRAGGLPSLSAFAAYGSQYNKVHGLDNRAFSQQFFTDNTYLYYGLAINIPIFNGLGNRASYTQSKIAYQNATLDREKNELIVKSEVLNAYLNYNDALKVFELANAQMVAAEKSYSLNKESYDLGLLNLIEFSQANRDYFMAKSDLAQARFTLMFQGIMVHNATGTLAEEHVK